MFHHAIVGHLRAGAGTPALTRCFAGHAPPDKAQEIYVVVEPAILINNNETQTGQCSPKKSMMVIHIFGCAKHNLIELEAYSTKIKSLLSNRNYSISGYHVYGTLLLVI